MAFDNPWWEPGGAIDADIAAMPPRAYFDGLYALIGDRTVNRAVVLMGPRRVGKTVLLYQCIDRMLRSGADARRVLYVPLDAPVYSGMGLERLLDLAFGLHRQQEAYVFFDEVQYLKDWEVHLKSLVDSFRNMRFVVSGSAAAALRLKSNESGAGRFTEFVLPPLSFHEYLSLAGRYPPTEQAERTFIAPENIEVLNAHFIDYINFGGYPEAALSKTIRSNPGRYIRGDVIDKVLLRDLPSLYGIDDVQALNALFGRLAYNTGQEVSLDSIAQQSGLAKNTVRKFIEYLEAAFLIARVSRIDDNAAHFKRLTKFKIYLTNPSLRAALFEPIGADSPEAGALVETAIFSQWLSFPDPRDLHYARWDRQSGEVDVVRLMPGLKRPMFAAEIKWTDRFYDSPHELRSLIHFAKSAFKGAPPRLLVTTRTKQGTRLIEGLEIQFVPSALYCLKTGLHAGTIHLAGLDASFRPDDTPALDAGNQD